MKHLKKISQPKQKKADSPPRGQIGKIITLSLIGVGAYLLLSRQKAFAEEIPEEYTPSEKPQDQLTKELYEQLSRSTVVERATEMATVAIKEATEKANIEIQQIKEATATTIAEIIKKADEDLETLKREMEASTMKTEDLIREYRARDEVIRAEAEQKIELARIEAEQKDQAARDEAARQVEIARIEAEQKVQAARIETEQKIETARREAEEATRVAEFFMLESPTIHIVTNSYEGRAAKTEDVGAGRNLSYDLNPGTYQGIAYSSNDLEGKATIVSQHEFPARTISKIEYKISVLANNWGRYFALKRIFYKVAYKVGNNWTNIASYDSGEVGGYGQISRDTGFVIHTFPIPLSEIVAVRAEAYAFSAGHGGEGGCNGYARIYEIRAIGKP